MYLRLKLSANITVTFRIRNYNPNHANAYVDWCLVDLTVKKPKVLNYKLYDDESLDSCEIGDIIQLLENVLNGCGPENYEPLEPYMVFDSVPENSEEDKPLHVYWRIYIWAGKRYNSSSTISLCLYYDDIEALLTYLKFVTGDVDEKALKRFVKKRIIMEDDGKSWVKKRKPKK